MHKINTEFTIKKLQSISDALRLEEGLNQIPGVKANVNFVLECAYLEYDPELHPLGEIIKEIRKQGFEIPMQRAVIKIEGMSCVSCSQTIEKALKNLPGVLDVSVNFASSQATIDFNPDQVSSVNFVEAIQSVGYRAVAKNIYSEEHVHDAHVHGGAFVDFFTSGLLTLPLILQMVGMGVGFYEQIPLWIQAILSTVVQFWCGWRFYVSSYYALRAGSANMDVLIALGTTAAYAFSLAVWIFKLPEHVYFESSATIITLILLGRWLESLQKEKASQAIEKLLQLQPKTARVERNGIVEDIPIGELTTGEIFFVRPGESVPVDGVVQKGESSVNEAMLTGESVPVFKKVGAHVYAGTMNQNGVLKVEAEKVGSDTMLAAIMRMVEQAQNSKAPIQRLADKVSAIFVPLVVLISALTFLGWLVFGSDIHAALINVVAILIIACPCALGLATPTVIMVAAGRAANFGILFKEASALEKAEKINVLLFDKTGTLTEGKPIVKKIVTLPPYQESEVIQVAASLEHNSLHPIAQAIVNYANLKGVPIEPTSRFETISGVGVTAEKRNKRYFVGSIPYAKEKGVHLTLDQMAAIQNNNQEMVSVVWHDQEVLGYILIQDEIRESSRSTIDSLKKMNIQTIMLTGDREQTAASVAKDLGIQDYFSGILPDKKAQQVALLKENGKTVGMVGDGINDAPALAAADVGFSFGAGSDVAVEASDITLIRNDLRGVVDAIALSRRAFQKIRQNLFFAFIYNVLGIPLAALGYLDPVIAAIAMALSSLSVVSNALLLRRWHPDSK